MANPKFLNHNRSLTKYALMCGYVQRKHGVILGYDGNRCFFVRHERAEHTFDQDSLTQARKKYKQILKDIKEDD